MSQSLSSYHWTEVMAAEATCFYFTPTFTFMVHTCFLLPQGLITSYHWTEAMAEEATYFYMTSTHVC